MDSYRSGTLLNKAYRVYSPIDVYTLSPKWRARERDLVHFSFKEPENWLWIILATMLIASFWTVLHPAEYPIGIALALVVPVGEATSGFLRTLGRFKRLPEECEDEAKNTLYRILMAQILGWQVIRVEGLEYRV